MAFVLVQHLDPNHESIPEILQKPLQFRLEIADDIKVEQSYLCYPAIKYWWQQMAFYY
jgi:hypothetical protein